MASDKVPVDQYVHPTPPPSYPGFPQQETPGYPHPPAASVYPHLQNDTGYPHPPADNAKPNHQPHAGPGYPVVQPMAVAYPPQALLITPPLGPTSTRTTCKSCGAEISSRIDRKSNMKTHLFALLLCVFGCWPCCLIPYCMESCKDAHHYCPSCDSYLGTFANH